MNLKRLIQTVNKKHGISINDYKSLWEWSTNSTTAPLFWIDLFDFLDIKSHGQPTCAFKAVVNDSGGYFLGLKLTYELGTTSHAHVSPS